MSYKCAWEKSVNLFWQVRSRKVAQACHPPREKAARRLSKARLCLLNFTGRHCHHQLSLLLTLSLQYFPRFSKVNRGSTQWDTCSFSLQQVINLRVRPARHRLNMLCFGWFMSAVSCWVHLAVKSWGFHGGEGVAGEAMGWWVSDLSYRKTDL